eukprot:CAMPEP_0119034520 /NCGR_PEP_ID=MMETSP1177-20130426/1503_1 /TAXON_ID=2985 /ORGANISM="Ochromonas sp, Strain CCMP1899" /LENGTH=309 /DNA_ID=CAMNT_0006991999 /DNA_START=160 /DNA_END=1089 /DNA_ORIENTATION=+
MITSGFSLIKSSRFHSKLHSTYQPFTVGLSKQPIPNLIPFSSPANPAQTVSKDPEFGKQIINNHFPSAIYPENTDQQVIEQRQINRSAIGLFGVEKARCKHGFPQAYVQYPVGNGISSGMVRLSCPHLVKAVDEYERQGALDEFDALVADYDSKQGEMLRSSFGTVNEAWRDIKMAAVTPGDLVMMNKKLGQDGANSLMNSGIIGCTFGKLQVKCLHAHIGDHMIRGDNLIGEVALEKLTERGVDVKGCGDCWQQCDLNHVPTNDSWWYTSIKNKTRLTAARVTRNSIKAKKLEKAALELEASIELKKD